MTAKIIKWGNSQGIRIPKIILDEIHWNSDDSFDISVIEDTIVIKKEKKRPTIKELFEGYNGNYEEMKEFDWGDPKGDEVW